MATLQSGKCFTVPTFFGMCCKSEWQERMYIYKWHEVDQTKHEIFCVHIVCNEIQVKVNLEITTFFFYLRFPYCPNFFWFGVVNFAFHLEIKVPESGGRVERHIIHVAWSPVWSFHSQWWFGLPCHLLVLVHCVFWSPQSTQSSLDRCLNCLHLELRMTVWQLTHSISLRRTQISFIVLIFFPVFLPWCDFFLSSAAM